MDRKNIRWPADHSALIPADLMTLAHFSVSSAISLAKSAAEPASAVPPTSPVVPDETHRYCCATDTSLDSLTACAQKRYRSRCLAIDFAGGAGVENLDLQPHGGSSRRHVSQYRLGIRSIGRIDEHGNTHGCGHHLTQEFQPLCR